MTGSTKRDKTHYRSLTWNMVAFVVAVSLVPLLLTGGVTLSYFSGAYESKVRDHLRELAHKHSQNIDFYLADRLTEIRVLTRSRAIEQLNDAGFLRHRLALLREEYRGAFVDLGLVDSKGVQINYAGPFNLSMADYSKADWFKKSLGSEDYISDVFTGLRGTPHFIVAVKKRWQNQTYIVKATIDFHAFNALVENIAIGETGFAFIVNQEGRFQTKPRYDVSLKKSPYREMLQGRLDLKRTPVFELPDAQGRESLFTLAPIKGGQWILSLQQQASDAYSSMYNTVTIAAAIIILSSAIILILAVMRSRRIVERIQESDEQQTEINEKVIETGRLASIGELAAGIAHEINNPVAIMVEEAGWIDDILSEDKPIDEEDLAEIERAVQQIRTQGSRCKDITYKLLSFARKTDPTRKDTSLNEIIEEVIGLLSQKSRFASVEIESKMAEDLPHIIASPSEIQQIVLNLMNNAVDAIGKDGGVVTVETSQDEEFINLLVSDTGEGIAEANLARIFDPFFTTKAVGQGTGLGLSICFGIANKMGGDIKVASAVNQGTTFTVKLPLPGAENTSHSESDRPSIQTAGSGYAGQGGMS